MQSRVRTHRHRTESWIWLVFIAASAACGGSDEGTMDGDSSNRRDAQAVEDAATSDNDADPPRDAMAMDAASEDAASDDARTMPSCTDADGDGRGVGCAEGDCNDADDTCRIGACCMPGGAEVTVRSTGAVACVPHDGTLWQWPYGKRAAVSLTYDDAYSSHYTNVAPVLEANGVRGTFFLTTGVDWNDLTPTAPWTALFSDGHEIASHGHVHYCNELPSLTLAEIESDMDASISFLRGIGITGPLTYGYPCGITTYGPGGTGFEPSAMNRFVAARGTSGNNTRPLVDELSETTGLFFPQGCNSLDCLVRRLEIAKDETAFWGRHAWVVVGMHAVGPGGSGTAFQRVDQVVHDEVVAHVANDDELWVAPFLTIADYVARCR